MKTLPIVITASLAFFLFIKSPLAFAQYGRETSDTVFILEGFINAGTCLAINPSGDLSKQNFQLPALKTTTLDKDAFSSVTPIELNLNSQLSDNQCSFGGSTITFDSSLASVSPNLGLLRNSARSFPAENVLLQIGLLNETGQFSPIDLSQPQLFNQALNNNATSAGLGNVNTLKLGIRYVTTRAFASQLNTNLNNPNASQDVIAGNISVFLPFLLKLN
jgi:hypothetical protein